METTASFSLENEKSEISKEKTIRYITSPDGKQTEYNASRINQLISEACEGFEGLVSAETVARETNRALFEGISSSKVMQAAILSARSFL